MYLPKNFEVTDFAEIKKFVAHVASADFVTTDPTGQPLATLMPCIWLPAEDGGHGKLIMHMSRGNQQWKSISNGQKALAIVHGPQAYVSPVSYEAKQETGKVVPTWNYTSVHFSGTVELTEREDDLLEMVSDLTNFHEASEANPWKVSDAPTDYIASQLRAIIGVTLNIENVEAKAKLNQNRSVADRAGVIEKLSASEDFEDQAVARLMDAQDSPNRLT